MSPRKYDLTRRRAAAEATRQQILEAARSLIGGKGDLDEFSMETVAEKAGVARMTVYHQFGSRAGLLEGLADHLASRGGMMRLREAFVESDPEVAVRKFVRTFVGFWVSDRVTMRRLRAMAVVFPSQDRGPRERDEWRKEGVSNLLHKISDGALPPGRVSKDDLVELLSVLTSFETFDALCTEERSPEMVARIITDAAVRIMGLTPRAAGQSHGVTGQRARTSPATIRRNPRARPRATAGAE